MYFLLEIRDIISVSRVSRGDQNHKERVNNKDARQSRLRIFLGDNVRLLIKNIQCNSPSSRSISSPKCGILCKIIYNTIPLRVKESIVVVRLCSKFDRSYFTVEKDWATLVHMNQMGFVQETQKGECFSSCSYTKSGPSP